MEGPPDPRSRSILASTGPRLPARTSAREERRACRGRAAKAERAAADREEREWAEHRTEEAAPLAVLRDREARPTAEVTRVPAEDTSMRALLASAPIRTRSRSFTEPCLGSTV